MYFLETRYFAERFCLFRRFRLKSRSRCFEPDHSLSGGTHLNPIDQKLFKQLIPSPIAQPYASSWRREREFQQVVLLVSSCFLPWISSSKRFQNARSLSSKLITATRASHLYCFRSNQEISDLCFVLQNFWVWF